MREFSILSALYYSRKRERDRERDELIIVMPDGSELLERLMKVFLTLLLKMQLRGWQLLLVLQLVILPRVKRVSWFQVWYVSFLCSHLYHPSPSQSLVLFAPLTDPAISLLSPLTPLEARLTSSGDHTETQYSQDYG
jgi:hypothetical protein